MAKSDGSKKGNKVEGIKTKAANKSVSTSKNKKRGWSHLIDKRNYSSGPGDNIFVYG
ncbi:hypothetical protein KJ632_05240 [Patescibacteria group bacterium]|nr:hypothetical protein [Patescibacteria group bacterium]